jgi:release factor glutamine methyltransferase
MAITDILFSHRLLLKRHETGLKRNEILPAEDMQWFEQALRNLKKGIPVQYITGQAEFYDLGIHVTPEVLIPRPETEELVRWIIEENTQQQPVIMDIGTGSGCIALALKKHIPGSGLIATDVDGSALVVASRNAAELGLDLQFFLHDILEEFPPGCLPRPDIIVSNPPYIPQKEKKTMSPLVTYHEPAVALFVPDDQPLLFYEAIAAFSRKQLRQGGQLYLEVHENYGTNVIEYLHGEGYLGLELRQDMNGKDRMIKAIQP